MGLSGPDAAQAPPDDLHVLVTGSGTPVTVAAHGLGASLPETRPLLTGVAGTRVLAAARGHAGSPPPPAGFGYAGLAADLRAVADASGATRALGVSMGASTLLRLLAATPDRFERVVLFLPAAVDRARTDDAVRRLADLAAALEQRDEAAVRAHVLAEVPADLHGERGVAHHVTTRTAHLLSCAGLPVLLRGLAADRPVEDRSALGAVTAEVLVVGQEGDPLHPAQVARELVAVLPRARLVVFDRPGAALRERPRLRALVGEALADGRACGGPCGVG